jgi:hypothetical protein
VQSTYKTIHNHINEQEAESEYFRLRWYLKGTCHFEFKKESLWLRLNITATDGKAWLPGDLKRRYEQEASQLQLAEGQANHDAP